MTGQYYADVIQKLRQAIKDKRRGKSAKGVLLLHDNAPVHKALAAKSCIRECGFEELIYPPYSPDLAPSDYYLFRNLKSHIRGTRNVDNEQLTEVVEAYLDDQSKSFYLKGIESLESKWMKCIDLRGEYIEKE